jgi:hypothetical protein
MMWWGLTSHSINQRAKCSTLVSRVLMVPATESSLIGSGDAWRTHIHDKSYE